MSVWLKFIIQWSFILILSILCTYLTFQIYIHLWEPQPDDTVGNVAGLLLIFSPFFLLSAHLGSYLKKNHPVFRPPFLHHYVLRWLGFQTILDDPIAEQRRKEEQERLKSEKEQRRREDEQFARDKARLDALRGVSSPDPDKMTEAAKK